MGVYVSNWRLARAVAAERPGATVGTVSGTALDVVYVRLLQLGDPGGHVRRVQQLSDAIARRMQQRGVYADELTPQLLDMIGLASILHDVGKVATPDAVLLKPGRHTDEERVQMQLHASVGRTILERAEAKVQAILRHPVKPTLKPEVQAELNRLMRAADKEFA